MLWTPEFMASFVKNFATADNTFNSDKWGGLVLQKPKVTAVPGQGPIPRPDVDKVNNPAAEPISSSPLDFSTLVAGGDIDKPQQASKLRPDREWIEFQQRKIFKDQAPIVDVLKPLDNDAVVDVLVVGAGFIGVEWVCELEHFFPNLKLTIIDFLPQCLGPLPANAAKYCTKYMEKHKIKQFYNCKYDAKNPEFWKQIEMPGGCDKEYVCIGVKASNYFMPKDTLSEKGPGGGGWIHFNKYMQVTKKPEAGGGVWADGTFFAVGDCNYGCIGEPGNWEMPPVPKISYPGEEQALHAIWNLERMDKGRALKPTWWPWGAGMFATSLGPHDACFVVAANENKGSGYMVNWWIPAALQKEIIETTKINECKNQLVGILIWHFVHHTPVHLWGKGFMQ